MSFERCKDTAIIIPARNEAERIGDCLTALAPQCTDRVRVILVVNNTDDDTGAVAQAIASHHSLDLTVLDLTFAPGMGVGAARQRGSALALEQMPHLRHILTTDADCRVSPDWIAQSLHHLQRVDAICGKVTLNPKEADCLAGLDPHLHHYEVAYRELVIELYARNAPNCADLRGSHGGAPGASLGFTRDAYETVGGFAPIPCGEDRQIIRALRALGKSVLHADDIWVEASCRLVGRAEGGMADTLRDRLAGVDYLADDCLPNATLLLHQLRQGALAVWPPQVPPSQRVRVRDLPTHIAVLSSFLHRQADGSTSTDHPVPDHFRPVENFRELTANAREPSALGEVELS
ncbi:hypothetical protein DSM110093_04046 (plasmid) [Sulfitobacter sp. DSM 110093]|uniref:glycosyltransferase n=1 Tax=Sulfitobacter sp. DSM 110093 TaxID=2883127 RepID=UPI001FAD7B1F|nr:glycosyltransferase family A protein [Sulfitobacter sp. DSM 110093]UOA34211.1 hypothetical protein DSM110093_04046 [Sulfitobacter sp. DSM 110093]